MENRSDSPDLAADNISLGTITLKDAEGFLSSSSEESSFALSEVDPTTEENTVGGMALSELSERSHVPEAVGCDVVADLIDLRCDESDGADVLLNQSNPLYRSPLPGASVTPHQFQLLMPSPSPLCSSSVGHREITHGSPIVVVNSTDSGISVSPAKCSADIMCEDEGGSSYTGIANGNLNGAISLLDSPLEPLRNGYGNGLGPMTNGNGQRRMSTSAFANASQLYNRQAQQSQQQQNGSSNYSGSRRSSFNSDIDMSISDVEAHSSDISEISSQVMKIQKQLTILEETHFNSDDKLIRLKQDNAVLQEKIHILEEQHQEEKDRWKEKFEEQRVRHKEQLQRQEREKALEAEALTYKFQLLEREHNECQREHAKLSGDLERVRTQNVELSEKIDSLNYQMTDLAAERDETNGKFARFKQEAETELRRQTEAIDELLRQLEEAKQQQKAARRLSSGSERAMELEGELSRLREEQRHLQETNEELQAQIFATSVAEGRSLLMVPPGVMSLADEIESMSKDDLLKALKEQEIVDQKLRAYVDGILLRIIEMYPAILEIQPCHGPSPAAPPPAKNVNPFSAMTRKLSRSSS